MSAAEHGFLDETWLTPIQIARVFGYSTDKPIRKAIMRGELKATRAPCGRRLLVPESRSALDRCLADVRPRSGRTCSGEQRAPAERASSSACANAAASVRQLKPRLLVIEHRPDRRSPYRVRRLGGGHHRSP